MNSRKQLIITCLLAISFLLTSCGLGQHLEATLTPYEELRINSGRPNRHELSHVEIMLAKQPLAELPTKGMHIAVVGLRVFEGQPLWNEIHPAWF